MTLLLICFIGLILGYFCLGKYAEKGYGADIHRAPKTDENSQVLPYRLAQLTQFGLTFGIEGLLGSSSLIFLRMAAWPS